MFGKLFARPPAEARARIEPGERLTAWGLTPDGSAVLSTTRGLLLPDGSRYAWHLIHKAVWNEGTLTVVPAVEVAPGVVADGSPFTVELGEPRDLPAEVRTRVTRSVAYSALYPVPGGAVRVIARRIPGQDGLAWVVRYDSGADIGDPSVRAAAEIYLAEAKTLV